MAYAQTNYQEKVGNGPYSIAEIGCFLTAFCNLLQEEYGISIDPPTLNQEFINNDLYLPDPADGAGVKDDLSWNRITNLYPQVVVTGIGGAGWPSTGNAIVEFNYISQRTGQRTTHFCKVADPNAQTIVDSWDGKVKTTGEYGTPVAWATYGSPVVQAVQTAVNPPTPPPAPTPPVPPNTVYTRLDQPLDLIVNKNPTQIWDLGFVNDAHATSVGTLALDTPFVAYGKAQRTDGDKPAYFMTNVDFGEAGATGIPTNNHGVNTVDLSPPPAPTANADGSENIPVKVLPPDPNKWQQSYKAFLSPQKFIAKQTELINDLGESSGPAQNLVTGAIVEVQGSFDKDGKEYYRTVKSVENNQWYGIPQGAVAKDGDISEAELDHLLSTANDIRKEIGRYTSREKLIVKFAKLEGFFSRHKK